MLKIRIIAALSAIVLTLITIYLVPKVAYLYTSFVHSLNHGQQLWLNVCQALLGVLVAAYGYWRWKKKKSQPRD